MTSTATRRRIEGDRPAPAETPLAERSTSDLLTAAYALTHRIHEASDTVRAQESTGRVCRWGRQTEGDLRAQRDLITAEVLRRIGDAR